MTTLEEYLTMNPWQRQVVNRERVALGLAPYHALKGQVSHMKGKPSPRKGIKTGPNGTKGIPKPLLHGPKPHRWICGPDPELHKMYDPHLKAKAQAMYRGEEWLLTFDEFAEFGGAVAVCLLSLEMRLMSLEMRRMTLGVCLEQELGDEFWGWFW